MIFIFIASNTLYSDEAILCVNGNEFTANVSRVQQMPSRESLPSNAPAQILGFRQIHGKAAFPVASVDKRSPRKADTMRDKSFPQDAPARRSQIL